jgi:hypothetical protein
MNIGTTLQILAEVSHIEFQLYLWIVLWDSWKSPLTALCKLDFIMDKNRNYPTSFGRSLPHPISTIFVKRCLGYMEKSSYGLM